MNRSALRLAAASALFFSLASASPAQPGSGGWWPAVRRFLLPDELAGVYELREAIRSLRSDTTFDDPLIHRRHDLDMVDSIYLRSLDICEGNVRDALVICAVATLPYHTFPAIIPLTGIVIWIPVSTESRETYERRLAALPGQLYPDSPRNGDRDKLPHFFGSAWLYVVIRHAPSVSLIGRIVEVFESVFKLEGSQDERDIDANAGGILFGKMLLERDHALPSEAFQAGE